MYTELVLYSCCKTVYLVQSQPKFNMQITKAIFVIGSAAIEVTRAIQSLLKHCPPPTGCRLVTEDTKGTVTIRVNCINTATCFTRFVQLSTVLLNCWKT